MRVFWCEEALGVLGIVVDDVGAEHDFAPGLVDALAHLERHRASELVDARTHECGGFCDHGRSLGEGLVPPGLEAGRGGCKRRLELLVGEFLERLQELAVIGIDALVGHGFVLPF